MKLLTCLGRRQKRQPNLDGDIKGNNVLENGLAKTVAKTSYN